MLFLSLLTRIIASMGATKFQIACIPAAEDNQQLRGRKQTHRQTNKLTDRQINKQTKKKSHDITDQ